MAKKEIKLYNPVDLDRAIEHKHGISVEEMEDLIIKVKEFIAERGNPRMNPIWLSNLIIRRLRGDRDYYINCEGEKGCLSEDTLIRTPEGLIKIKDIKSKKLIVECYDFKNKISRYTPALLINSGVKQLYEIKTIDGKIIKATEDHTFFVERNNNEIIEVKLKDLNKYHDKLLCKEVCKSSKYNSQIISIKKIEKKQTYDFKVPIYNNLILGNDVVTHNSGKSNLILLLALLQSRYAGLWKNKTTGKIFKFLPTNIEPDKNLWEQLTVDFSFDKNMSFLDATKDVRDKYNSLSRFSSFVMDEGSKNLHKHNWQSKLQFSLIQMSDTERYQNKSFFVCFPNFKELNSVFRNDRIKMRLYVYTRFTKEKYASAIISVRDLSRWTIDPWHMEDNAKLFEKLLYKTPSALRNFKHIIYAERKLKGYSGVFDFPSLKDISPKIWKTYMNYKLKYAAKEGQDSEESELNRNTLRWKLTTKSLMEYIKTIEPKITNIQLSKIMKMSPSSVGSLLKERLGDTELAKEMNARMESLKIDDKNNRKKHLAVPILPKSIPNSPPVSSGINGT